MISHAVDALIVNTNQNITVAHYMFVDQLKQ